MAGERRGRRHPRPPPGLGDLRDDDLRLHRRRPSAGSPVAGDRRGRCSAIGIGLTLDEFALWLELKDVYWEKDGRKSIDAMIIAGCLGGDRAGRALGVGRRSPTTSRRRSSPRRRIRRRGRDRVALGQRGKGEVRDGARPASIFRPAADRERDPACEAALTLGPAVLRRARRLARGRASAIRPGAGSGSEPPASPPGRAAVADGGPELVVDRAQRGGDRDRQQGAEDASELGAGEDDDDPDDGVRCDRTAVEDGWITRSWSCW